ncbi:MAG TPA: aspartate--tRNA ligase, partial [Planctomycetota bacterium]|nr:aspartate--tRNA ligase [Planctomycetota bacterium]
MRAELRRLTARVRALESRLRGTGAEPSASTTASAPASPAPADDAAPAPRRDALDAPHVRAPNPPTLPVPAPPSPHAPVPAAPRRPRPPGRALDALGARVYVWLGGIAPAPAVTFFLKYAVDHFRFPPEGRCLGATLFGLGLIAAAEKFRVGSRTIAQSLSGAGAAVLYAALYASAEPARRPPARAARAVRLLGGVDRLRRNPAGAAIRRRSRAIRAASAVVMPAAIFKVFPVDAPGLRDLGRVASFLGLGVSLIVVARVYQSLGAARRGRRRPRPDADPPAAGAKFAGPLGAGDRDVELKRTHTCGELRAQDAGKTTVLNGWVAHRRDHGGIVFIDLRDRYGFTQVVVDGGVLPAVNELRAEYVVAVQGKVRLRPEDARNASRSTGDVEVVADRLEILNTAKTPPFEVADQTRTREDLRLEYRYLDLRRRPLLENMLFRSKVCDVIRRVFQGYGFCEVETPLLIKTTPEGARDFVVPSRLHPGQVYALPQSPQLFKQTLMASGLDRYFQICKCLRDEDLRADRQPEFTQLDMEMSFVSQEDVFDVVESTIVALWGELLGVDLPRPFKRLTYDECMRRFGIDKPDTRFGLELFDVTDVVRGSGFKVFAGAASAARGSVKGICVRGGCDLTRSEIDEAEGVAKAYGAAGLAWIKLQPDGPQGPIVKFLKPEEIARIV